MCHSTSARRSVQPSPAAYCLALQQFRAALHQLKLAGERLRSLPADGIESVQERVAFAAACEDAQALCWTADKSQPFLSAVAFRLAGHAAERAQRDEATMPADDDTVDLAEIAAQLAS